MSEWVSVEDRLPEVGVAVLATRKTYEAEKGFQEWWFGCCIYREFGFPWVLTGDPDNSNPVTHWMPLPDHPPATEQELHQMKTGRKHD